MTSPRPLLEVYDSCRVSALKDRPLMRMTQIRLAVKRLERDYVFSGTSIEFYERYK